jgi:hypothetical protein
LHMCSMMQPMMHGTFYFMKHMPVSPCLSLPLPRPRRILSLLCAFVGVDVKSGFSTYKYDVDAPLKDLLDSALIGHISRE